MNHRWMVLLFAGFVVACSDGGQDPPHGRWAQRLQPEMPSADVTARREPFGSVRQLDTVEWPKR